MRKLIITTFLFLIVHVSFGQIIENVKKLNELIDYNKKNLIIIGEEHTSAANPKITYELITYLHTNSNLRNLLIEFGPSEAYLYNQYLHTGDESFLEKTIYAGVFKEWKDFYRRLHQFNIELPLEDRILIIGIDFERPQTFAHAFNKMASKNKINSPFIDSLNQTFNEDFYKSHTNRFPSEDDKILMNRIKLSLKSKVDEFKNFQPHDYQFLQASIDNNVEGFAGNREEELKDNILRVISESNSSVHLLLIGQGHVDLQNENVVYLLKNNPSFKVTAGKIFYFNSKQWTKGFKKEKLINELKNKPWKRYKDSLKEEIVDDGQFDLLLLDKYPELQQRYDFIVVAKNQNGLSF